MINRFYTLEEINPKLKILQDNFDAIQQEFLENKDKLVFINWGAQTGYAGSNAIAYDGWQVAPLYGELKENYQLNMSLETALKHIKLFENAYQQKINVNLEQKFFNLENSNYLPLLTKCLREANIVKRVGISVVYPGKGIKWHIDPDPEMGNNAIIRGLFGLDIHPGKNQDSCLCLGQQNNHDKRFFRNNEFIFFWGRISHCVENSLQSPRYAVCFDQDIDKDYLRSLN